MSEDQHPTMLRAGEIAAIHAAITTLSVDVGRLTEKLTAIDGRLNHHMIDEHKEFREAFSIVADIQKQINTITGTLNQQRGAWWALAKIGAVILVAGGVFAWLIDIYLKLTQKGT